MPRRHLLISATYDSDRGIPSRDVSTVVVRGLRDFDVDVAGVTTYTQTYEATVQAACLKDAWMDMSDSERANLPVRLVAAICVLLGVGVEVDVPNRIAKSSYPSDRMEFHP